MRLRQLLPVLASTLLIGVVGSCGGSRAVTPQDGADGRDGAQGQDESCPRALPAPHLLPGTRPEHREPGFWISRIEGPDELVLTTGQIAELNERAEELSKEPRLGSRRDLLAGAIDPAPVLRKMGEGLSRHRERTAEGGRVFLDGERPPDAFFDEVDRIQRDFAPLDELRLANRLIPLRCHPAERGLYEYAGDVDFDLIECSNVHSGELLRLVSRHPEGWRLARSPYAFGWAREADLGPAVSEQDARGYLGSERFVVVVRDRSPVWSTPSRTEQQVAVDLGLRLPLLGRAAETGLLQVLAPGPAGLASGWMEPQDVIEGYLPLTRRNVIRHAFARLDDGFGWAGAGGDRDCSRLLMDLFALFGLRMPRNSYWQSQAGAFSVDTTELSLPEREAHLDRALSQGIVLLFMPGHIMLLLGRDGSDYFAIHQFSGYRVGCRPGRDVKMAVDRVSVTTLRLGEGSERRSFMERFTRIVVIGQRGP